MSIRKIDVYKFINDKEREVLKSKSEPLRDLYLSLQTDHFEKIMVDSGLRDVEFIEAVKVVKHVVETLRDNLDYGSYAISDIIKGLDNITTEKDQSNSAKSRINYDYIIPIREARIAHENMRSNIIEEFSKIKAAAKSAKSAKQACTILEELGFDISGIVSSKKNEVAVLTVDSTLLGLPENK